MRVYISFYASTANNRWQ